MSRDFHHMEQPGQFSLVNTEKWPANFNYSHYRIWLCNIVTTPFGKGFQCFERIQGKLPELSSRTLSTTNRAPPQHALKLGTRPLEGSGFFLIQGVLRMMFHVLAPLGIGSIWFFHCFTLDLGAEVEKRAFRLSKTATFGVFMKSETSWIGHVFIPWTSNSTVGRFLFVTATFRVPHPPHRPMFRKHHGLLKAVVPLHIQIVRK